VPDLQEFVFASEVQVGPLERVHFSLVKAP
jgi:hypothetical protein